MPGRFALSGSNVKYSELHTAMAVLGDALVSVQNYYNVMFHHGASDHCPDTEEILDECELREWAFVAWEPMGTGIEFPVDDQEKFRRRAHDLITTIGVKHHVTPHVSRLAAVLSRSKQIIAIPGTSSLAHPEANMSAMRLSEMEDFAAAWRIPRKVVMSLRKQRELDELERRLQAPVENYSANGLLPWTPRTTQRDDKE
jgi:aryl-alcohol dehydrogenase-like predicted oxidoreductase